MNNSKLLWTSKTFILNAAVTAVAVVTALQAQPWIIESPKIAAGLVAIAAVAGIIVRVLTTQPVSIM